MADIRINALATTAASTASDDFVAVDGSANGTRKLNAFSPTFGGNLTVSGTATISGASGGLTNLITGNSSAGNYIFWDANASPSASDGYSILGVRAFSSLTGSQTQIFGIDVSKSGAGTDNKAKVFFNLHNGTNLAPFMSVTDARNTTLAGNLTVSGTGTSSVAGNFGIGTTSTSYKVDVNGSLVSTYTNNPALALLRSTDSQAANKGGGLLFGGVYSGTDQTEFAYIGGVKENGTAGNYAGKLVFGTRANGTGADDMTRMTLTSGGKLLLGPTSPSGSGALELATHTTSAGGIGFGTDVSLFRGASNELHTNALSFKSTNANPFYIASTTNNIVFQPANTTALTLDSSQNATFAGKITANGVGSTFKGTATNDSAAAGYMGEYAETSTVYASRITLTTDTVANVASVSLTAGDWDVSGNVELEMSGVTSTDKRSGVSTTSASLTNNPDTCGVIDLPTTTLTGYLTIPTPTVRISIASTTTVYLPTKVTFSAGTTKAWGIIRARRVR